MSNETAFAAWHKGGGDVLCTRHPLTEDSVVFDVGGYEGNWAKKIVENYNPFIRIFEPAKSAYNTTKARFQSNPKIQVFNFGLSDRDAEVKISLRGDGSSMQDPGGIDIELVQIKDVAQILISPVDLISINIEGEEYNLLSRMITAGIIPLCQNIQIQFHDMYPDSERLRQTIREKFSVTHTEVYNYPFVWECWRAK